jgi:polar amino acid transport system substrate-binding protein
MSRRVAIAALTVLSLAGVACSGDARLPGEVVGDVAAPSTTAAPPAPECTAAEEAESATRTYPPLDEQPEHVPTDRELTVAEIRDRGQLVVGVSGDTLLFGSRDPLEDVIEGFDIDVLKEVAEAIFGPDGEDRIVYRVITYAQRLPALEARDVDIVAHTMTINCRRWKRINFSSVYYQAGQKVLVKQGSGFSGIDDLNAAQARVCAPEGSTNIDFVRDNPEYPDLVVVGKPDITDCLVAMQQGQADATTGDDTVLAGFAAQDPSTIVVGDRFTEEPYGLGFNRDDVELTRFVNGVLRDITASGRLDEIARTWLVDTGALPVEQVPPVPEPDHTRPLP